ncbi:Glycosyltransferase involved in cell wall bisynthesis [Pseudobutyrivibrio sp. ACV-2]|uniref:glycosyltransferase family 4 protein n=1 Tax=Pseudobutyrivibrio sp. ACV-2 TaxID=1520801 RepID=UPI00089DA409|nr:glycosyltransferase family 4 protein [Pseudobutyrivibrio sp. ACV-2]SEA97004.1 Glycosyltransferase involved in cell wall bisynthesis [Pseudobutyrivibrio sp. ACV-2]
MNTGGNKKIALFVGGNDNAIGGMETHAKYFCRYFKKIGLLNCVVRKEDIFDIVHDRKQEYSSYEEMTTILRYLDIGVFFFNDGHWIEKFSTLRKDFSSCVMIMRSGGNEFMKAPVTNMSLPIFERQQIWARELNKLDYVISNSSYSTHRMISIGIMKEKIVMVRGGVDTELCRSYARIKLELHRELANKHKIEPSACLLGIVSRFEKFKGIEQTIEALSYASDVKWHLFIAGSGPEKNNILIHLNKWLKPDQYTFLGQLDIEQSMKLIASVDFLINMSLEYERESGMNTYVHTETMGRSMMEAVCCGTPVIATKVGGIPELFEEQGKIGVIVANNKFLAKELEVAIKRNYVVSAQQIEKYDWSYIFNNIYQHLMNIEEKVVHKTNLVVDLEGSIIHDFCDVETNKQNFLEILQLSNICNVIINTAGELDDIFKHYPYVNDYVDKIVIIANCGRKVLLYGDRFLFWEKYYESLYAPNEKIIEQIREYIEREGIKVTKISKVDKLYINFKADGIGEDITNKINALLKDTPYKVCNNNSNIKLISEEIEKGNTLRFICKHVLKTDKSIGIGNGVLDMSFLNQCQKAYFINPKGISANYIGVEVRNPLNMRDFLGVLQNEVKKESSFCNS